MGFGRENGAQERPKGCPGGAKRGQEAPKRGPRAFQERSKRSPSGAEEGAKRLPEVGSKIDLIFGPFFSVLLSIFLIKNESQQVRTNDETVKAVQRANIKKHRKNLGFFDIFKKRRKRQTS